MEFAASIDTPPDSAVMRVSAGVASLTGCRLKEPPTEDPESTSQEYRNRMETVGSMSRPHTRLAEEKEGLATTVPHRMAPNVGP